ncbi:unnamed protein product [Phytophthora lilii]|uniref:Unnamed protein product n=1 Tax=Phytophthora lilii TaxID=2077276 RepID=A0A9W6U5A3_9STRA|nr:unnamed protein product [Phytophthora lilii]
MTRANVTEVYPNCKIKFRAHVVLACRNAERGREAEIKLRETLASDPNAGSVEYMQVDVSDLSSVKKFAEEFKKTHDRLDLHINNAGVMGEAYSKTVDGYERRTTWVTSP